jgi:hypothetical protein
MLPNAIVIFGKRSGRPVLNNFARQGAKAQFWLLFIQDFFRNRKHLFAPSRLCEKTFLI